MSDEDEISAEVDRLIMEGAMIPDHIDNDGEMIYTFNMDKLKELNYPLWLEQVTELDDSIMNLMSQGYLDCALDGEGEMIFSLSDRGRAYVEMMKEMGRD